MARKRRIRNPKVVRPTKKVRSPGTKPLGPSRYSSLRASVNSYNWYSRRSGTAIVPGA